MRTPTFHRGASRPDYAWRVRGFTLVELLVSIAIISVITAVALVQQGQFNQTVALTNLAYEVALSVREAQVFGISVREFSDGAVTNRPYGVEFAREYQTRYHVYVDIDGNSRYSGENELVGVGELTRGNIIERFCGITGNTETCGSTTGSVTALRALSVQFMRPHPDAIIRGITNTGSTQVFDGARIYLMSPEGTSRCVRVRATGQVSVEQTCQ